MAANNTGYEAKSVVDCYVKYRPKIPPQLQEKILAYLNNGSQANARRELAVDIGCGSGQSTLPLCNHFNSVIGIDSSEAQLKEAKQLCADQKHIVFKLGSVESVISTIEKESVDLVNAGCALHFLDMGKFFEDCKRILKTGGVVAAYAVFLLCLDNEQAHDVVHEKVFKGLFGSYFPPRIARHVWDRYEEAFAVMKNHFQESNRDDSVRVECDYCLEDIFGYIKSFPQYHNYKADHPEHPDGVDTALEKLKEIFGTTSMEEKVIKAAIPIALIMGRKS